MVRHAVSRLHEVAVEFLVEHFDLSQPLARSCADPSGNQRARWKAVVFGELRAVHAQCDEGIFMAGLLNRNTADERWHFARNLVQTAKHDVLSGGFHSSSL